MSVTFTDLSTHSSHTHTQTYIYIYIYIYKEFTKNPPEPASSWFFDQINHGDLAANQKIIWLVAADARLSYAKLEACARARFLCVVKLVRKGVRF